jgi:hypothetical protein
MSRFIQGNVIKTKNGNIEIVADVDEQKDLTKTISIDASNCSALHRGKTYQSEEWCTCGMIDCEYCCENKPHLFTVYGMDKAIFLANNVKEWIIKSLTNDFDF